MIVVVHKSEANNAGLSVAQRNAVQWCQRMSERMNKRTSIQSVDFSSILPIVSRCLVVRAFLGL